MTDINTLISRATAKRDRIIAREGDDNGERMKTYYLTELVKEEMSIDMMRDRCMRATTTAHSERNGKNNII
jgi:hypothetical protein